MSFGEQDPSQGGVECTRQWPGVLEYEVRWPCSPNKLSVLMRITPGIFLFDGMHETINLTRMREVEPYPPQTERHHTLKIRNPGPAEQEKIVAHEKLIQMMPNKFEDVLASIYNQNLCFRATR